MQIPCPESRAYVKHRDTHCWHCQASLADHPYRQDVRYKIAYSRVASFALALLAVYCGLKLLAIPFVAILAFNHSNNLGEHALASLLGLIVSLRLLLAD